jgi:hypothetical protein
MLFETDSITIRHLPEMTAVDSWLLGREENCPMIYSSRFGNRRIYLATRVKFAIPEREIENTGITFKRDVDNELHGDLTIRQNHIDWRPKGNEFIYRIAWSKLAEFAEANGKRIRPKATAVKARKKLKGAV